MRAVIQRVSQAQVRVDDREVGSIGRGLVILLGVAAADDESQVTWLVDKIARLRIFADEQGRFNRSVLDAAGDCLVVSQFTLFASTKKGTRPGFSAAASPEQAIPLYEAFVGRLEAALGRPVPTGVFGASMAVSLVNDGPVTIIIDSLDRS